MPLGQSPPGETRDQRLGSPRKKTKTNVAREILLFWRIASLPKCTTASLNWLDLATGRVPTENAWQEATHVHVTDLSHCSVLAF